MGLIMTRDAPTVASMPVPATEPVLPAAGVSADEKDLSNDNTVEVMGQAVTAIPFSADDRHYGPYAAEILRKCVREVALSSSINSKLATFRECASTLGKAVVDQWLPKNVVVDRLVQIAAAHNDFGLDAGQIESIIADAIDATHSDKAPEKSSAKPKRRLISHRASELQPEKLTWVWPGRIPEGKLVLVGGPPGLGKSQLTAFIAATISNGGAWPCGEGSTAPGNVIMMSAEDGIEDTIIPRLIAAGANMDRIHIIASATKPDGTGRKTFSLKTDVDLLEAKAKEIGGVRLISVDPVSAYMGGADGNGNVETREVLEPLADMANRLKIAVVAVTHLNKGGAGNQNALNRFVGSKRARTITIANYRPRRSTV
jgi:putative DNA primase/helicase